MYALTTVRHLVTDSDFFTVHIYCTSAVLVEIDITCYLVLHYQGIWIVILTC